MSLISVKKLFLIDIFVANDYQSQQQLRMILKNIKREKMRGFNIASAATATSLVLLFATQSIAQDTKAQSATTSPATYTPPAPNPRYIKATIRDHFTDNNKREMTLDCETLLPVLLDTGEIKFSPRVNFAAQFDLSPPRTVLDQFNKMSPVQKQSQLASMPPYDASILKAVAELPPEKQELFYIARNDQRLLFTKDAENLYAFLAAHAMAAHGVDKCDFKRASNLCYKSYGLEVPKPPKVLKPGQCPE